MLPTYDERENIETVLRRVRHAAPLAHILVVDDASPDGTGDVAEAIGHELGGISVLHRAGPTGLGSAYRDGFRWGLERGYDVLVEMDADLSHDPAVLPVLLRRVEDGADLVIGSRYVAGGGATDWPFARRAISRIGCRYAQLMLRLPTRDATSGYRAYCAAALRAVDLDTVRANGYGFQVEMAYRVLRVGGDIQESAHPVPRPHRRNVEDVAEDRRGGVGAGDEVGRARSLRGEGYRSRSSASPNIAIIRR